jgi:polysaccharide export outer membrane protein
MHWFLILKGHCKKNDSRNNMRKQLFSLLLIILIGAVSVSSAGDYVVGEGDVLSLKVYENDDLSTTARVTYEGKISLPLLGQVLVKDMTVSGIEKKISRLLKDGYLTEPQVSIFIKEYRSRKAVILGEVNNPGIYKLREDTSLLELISQAEGLTKTACSKAIIKRKNGKADNVIKINIKNLVEKGEDILNIQVQNGDTIYIPKQDVYYVTGEVKKPDAYDHEESTSVIKAITIAGGFTAKASKTGIKIIRKIGDREEVISEVNMDVQIFPEDVIVVPESFF